MKPRFGGATPTRVRGDGTPLDLWFAQEPAAPGQPLVVFQHIRKTAGTSFRRILDNNFRTPKHFFMDVPKTLDSGVGLKKWYADYWAALSRKERESLFCVAAHSANYLIPHSERPVRGITLLRDPIDRVLSRYHFFGRPQNWALADQYLGSSKAERNPEFFNGQARSLLEPHFDVSELGLEVGPPADADLWRARVFSVLSKYYIVGIQERFAESIKIIGRELGWRHTEVPALRVNATRPESEVVDRDSYELIRAANWLDVEIHAHYTSVMNDVAPGEDGEPYEPKYTVPEKTGRVTVNDLSTTVEQLQGENLALRTRIAGLERQIRKIAFADPIRLPKREKAKAAEDGARAATDGRAKDLNLASPKRRKPSGGARAAKKRK